MKSLILFLSLALASVASGADQPAIYQAALANPARTDKDRERDLRDKPADILALGEIRPGMTVVDVFGAGGYWSEILTGVVGPKGSVLLVNNAPYVEFAKKEYDARFAGDRLPGVTRLVVDPADMKLGSGSADAAIIVMSYHDLYYVDEKNGWPAIDAAKFIDQVRKSLKPGGVFIVVDHSAKTGTGSAAAQLLHRIDEAFAMADIESHGFKLVKTWNGLRNPDDDRSKLVFDPSIRGKTDRFVQVYRKT